MPNLSKVGALGYNGNLCRPFPVDELETESTRTLATEVGRISFQRIKLAMINGLPDADEAELRYHRPLKLATIAPFD